MFLGMLSFFLFWGTLLFHIWPPSLYMTEVKKIGSQHCIVLSMMIIRYLFYQDMMFWRSSAPSPPPQTQSAMAEDQHHHTAVLEIDLDNWHQPQTPVIMICNKVTWYLNKIKCANCNLGVVVATLTNIRLLDVRGTDGHYSDVSSKLRLTPNPYCWMSDVFVFLNNLIGIYMYVTLRYFPTFDNSIV